MTCTLTVMSESYIMSYVSSLFSYFQVGWLLLMSLQYCISPFFLSDCMKHCRFTCMCHFCNKITNAVKGGTTSAAWLYRQHNQSIHMTGGMTVMSLFATPPTLDKNSHALCMSHRVKSKGIAYLQCQSALQRKLQQKFRKWCKCSSHVKAKLHKIKT